MKMLQLSFVLLSLVFVVGIGNADQAAYPDYLYRDRFSGDSDASANPGLPDRLNTPRTRGNVGANPDQIPYSTTGETSTDDPDTFVDEDPDSELKIYYVDTTVKATWFQALRLCRSRGMRLATVVSHEDQSYLDSVLTASGVERAWLSGNDLGLTNEYMWASTGQLFNFTFWNYGQPSHTVIGNQAQHCVEVTEFRWRWNDNLCTNREYFVCEYYSTI